jgi:hypothetical protein
MTLITDEDTEALFRLLRGSATPSTQIITRFHRSSDQTAEGHPRQDPPGAAEAVSSPEGVIAETRAVAASETYEPPRSRRYRLW